MCCCPNLDRLRHVVIRRRYRKRNVVGNVDQFALRQQRKPGERIRVFATSQRTNRANFGFVDF